MKHHDKNRKLGRTRDQRRALLRSLARSLIINGKIKTTEAKAKELRPFIEKLVTRAKTDTPTSRRVLISRLGSKVEVNNLVTKIAPTYAKRDGGYTRIIKLPIRKSDAAKMAQIEFV